MILSTQVKKNFEFNNKTFYNKNLLRMFVDILKYNISRALHIARVSLS